MLFIFFELGVGPLQLVFYLFERFNFIFQLGFFLKVWFEVGFIVIVIIDDML